jgi:hypothetical protein
VHGANASHKLERIWRDDEMLREWIGERILLHLESGRIGRREVSEFGAQAFNLAALGTVQMLNGKPDDARRSYRKSIQASPLRWQTYARLALTYAGTKRFRKFL